ncbi:MAG TPA: hypothetical protein VER55_13925 [Ardenticatenaceae bacterium]|nr:hypothetical protein [Ardenticatenaceae bacterium]
MADSQIAQELELFSLSHISKQAPAATLANYLRERHLLLVLDNREHLLVTCARVAEALLRAAPLLCILATGRESLGTLSATTLRVPSLTLPDPERLLHAAQPTEQLLQSRSVKPSHCPARPLAPALNRAHRQPSTLRTFVPL